MSYVCESDILWKVMTIWISRELSLFNFEILDELCLWIGHPVKSYDHLNFSSASIVQFLASRYFMSSNQTSEWNVMTIRICRELPLFNFELLDELCLRIGHPLKSNDQLNFSSASVVQFQASRYFMSSNQTSEWNVMTIRICRELPLFNFERLDELCLGIRHPVKIYDHSNLSRASVVQFWASWWVMSPNRTSVWKVMTIRIFRELLLFNFECLDILCPRIGHPSEILWPFKFFESFRCSILSF